MRLPQRFERPIAIITTAVTLTACNLEVQGGSAEVEALSPTGAATETAPRMLGSGEIVIPDGVSVDTTINMGGLAISHESNGAGGDTTTIEYSGLVSRAVESGVSPHQTRVAMMCVDTDFIIPSPQAISAETQNQPGHTEVIIENHSVCSDGNLTPGEFINDAEHFSLVVGRPYI